MAPPFLTSALAIGEESAHAQPALPPAWPKPPLSSA
jgi:hypothetical protein